MSLYLKLAKLKHSCWTSYRNVQLIESGSVPMIIYEQIQRHQLICLQWGNNYVQAHEPPWYHIMTPDISVLLIYLVWNNASKDILCRIADSTFTSFPISIPSTLVRKLCNAQQFLKSSSRDLSLLFVHTVTLSKYQRYIQHLLRWVPAIPESVPGLCYVNGFLLYLLASIWIFFMLH